MTELAERDDRGSCRGSSRGWPLVLAFYGVAVVIRLALMASYVKVPWIFDDELRYMREARSLALHHQFGIDGFPTFFDRPLYPLLISVFARMPDTDAALAYIRVLNVLLISVTVWGAWWLARQVMGRKESLWAAAVVAVWPLGFFSSVLMTENLLFPLATLFCGAVCWSWREWLEKEGRTGVLRQLVLGVLIGAAYYTHGRGILFAVVSILILVWFAVGRGLAEARGAQCSWLRWPVHILGSLFRAIWEWRYAILLAGGLILLWALRSKLAGGQDDAGVARVTPDYQRAYVTFFARQLLRTQTMVRRLLRIAGYYWSGGCGVVALACMVFLLSKRQNKSHSVLWVLVLALLLTHMGLAASFPGYRVQGRYVALVWPLLVVASIWALSRSKWGWRVVIAALAGLVMSRFSPAAEMVRTDALHDLSDLAIYGYLAYLPGATLWTATSAFVLLGAGCWISRHRLALVGSFLVLLWASAQWAAFLDASYYALGAMKEPTMQMAREVELLAGGADRTVNILVDREAYLQGVIMHCKFYSQVRFVETDVDALLSDAPQTPPGRLVMVREEGFNPYVSPAEVREAPLLLSRRDVPNLPLRFRAEHLRLYERRPVILPKKMSPGQLDVRVPSILKAGQEILFPVMVQNCSEAPWRHRDPHSIVAIYRWQNEDGELLPELHSRPMVLRKPLYPGKRRLLHAFIVVPEPGRYRLRWGIVCRGYKEIELVSPRVFDVEVRP